jgi:hypothetical protein
VRAAGDELATGARPVGAGVPAGARAMLMSTRPVGALARASGGAPVAAAGAAPGAAGGVRQVPHVAVRRDLQAQRSGGPIGASTELDVSSRKSKAVRVGGFGSSAKVKADSSNVT